MVDVVSTFQEDIIKAFRGLLSPPQIEVLIKMHEETRMLQMAISEQHRITEGLIEMMKLTGLSMKHTHEQLAKFEKKFNDDPNTRTVASEDYDG
jgi:uncharacterized coiled-coil protein SlyX